MLLENQKLASRTHGGATPHAAFNDVPLGYKTTQNLAEKRRIAECALQFLDGARVIGMTGGTTLTAFARLLFNREGLTVVTNALNIATDLVSGGNIRVFAAGGEVRTSSQECVGPTAERPSPATTSTSPSSESTAWMPPPAAQTTTRRARR